MKKTFFITTIFVLLLSQLDAQVFWTEDFDVACEANCPGDGYIGPNGTWTVFDSGINGAHANTWYVSDTECGNDAGDCGSVCSGSVNDPSLHLGSHPDVLGDQGSSYLNGGAGFFFPTTDKRIESPTIDCAGYADIQVDFNYIEGGQGVIDDATLWYYDGTDWSQIDALAKTPLGPCDPQGQWTAFTVMLPASANQNTDVKIGFRWINNDDLIGEDPSFAVDDITLNSLNSIVNPTALFEDPSSTICAGDILSFVDLSSSVSVDGITDWNWTFGSFDTSTDQNPTDILFADPGIVDIELIVTDEFGDSEPYVFTLEVEDCTPLADFIIDPSTVCVNQCVSFINNSVSSDDVANIIYSWDFGNTNTSADENPADECYPDLGTITVTLTITDSYGTDMTSQDIQVNDCTPPVADFSISDDEICANDCITLADLSIGSNITNWQWTFEGADISDFNGQNPGSVCYSSDGTFNVNLEVTDEFGTSDVDMTVIVNALPVVTATANVTALCIGDSVLLNGMGADSYIWDNGAIDNEYTIPALGTTLYTVVGTDSNGCEGSSSVEVEAIDCQEPIAAFSLSSQMICLGDCIDVTDLSENADTWQWNFGPDANPTDFIGPNPPLVCYDDVGTFSIELIVSNLLGSDTTSLDIVVNDLPTVTAFDEEVELGLEVVISATTDAIGGTYQWQPSNLADNPNNLVTSVSPTTDTNFIITVTDENGCSASDTAFVHVIIVPGVGVPNAFSPNEDGDNDKFGPLGEGYVIKEFVVYNRYGQQVFQTTEKGDYWDGKVNGVEQNPGVFYWYFRYTWFAGDKTGTTEEMSGQLTLIK